MSSTIIRKCVSNIHLLDTIKADFDSLYSWVKTENIDDGDYTGYKYYFSADEFVIVQIASNMWVDVIVGNDGYTEPVWHNLNCPYIAYTLVKTADSFAIAFAESADNSALTTNDYRIYVTKINGVMVGVYYDYQWFDGACKSRTEGNNDIRRINSAYSWAQLIPLGVPELAGASSDVFVIRYSPFAQSQIDIDGTKYMIGDYYAIRLED